MAARLKLGATGGQVEFSLSSTPSTPAAGYTTLFVNPSSELSTVNSSGTVVVFGAGGGTGGAGTSGDFWYIRD